MDGTVNSREGELKSFEGVLVKLVFFVEEICKFVKEGRVELG